ncbi:MAG: hypothetical protein JSS72_01230 [Armatimonadetes bacterium]|nr:hypothetical protein [Armatimonadota bacterium]
MSETPPPFQPGYGGPPPPPQGNQQSYGPAPMPKNNSTTVIVVVLGVLALGCIAVFGGLAVLGFNMWGKVSGVISCSVGFEQAGSAMSRYVKDKGKYPDAAKWQDEIEPYFKNMGEKNVPFKTWKAGEVWTCTDANSQTTGIAFNPALGGKDAKGVDPSMVVLFEVGTTGRNQHPEYGKQSKASAPTIMGEHRDWLTVKVRELGRAHRQNSGFEIDTDSSDGDGTDKSGAKDKAGANKLPAKGGKDTSGSSDGDY